MKGICRCCSCTDAQACAGGCSWADDTEMLCSRCAEAIQLVEGLLTVLLACLARTRPQLRGIELAWPHLAFDEQRLLVMATRAILERLEDILRADADDVVRETMASASAIAAFLDEHCPGELQPDDTLHSAVIRLLEPHVGRRILVP